MNDAALQKSVAEALHIKRPLAFLEVVFLVLSEAALPLYESEIYEEAMKRDILPRQCRTSVNGVATVGSIVRTHPQLFDSIAGMWLLRTRANLILKNVLVTQEYQKLGMTLFEGRYKYIPQSVEHRFLRHGVSTLGPHVGLGLFVREGRVIPSGCILSEYVGAREEKSEEEKDDTHLKPYAVTAGRGTSHHCVINGLDAEGNISCLAALANDAGPLFRNAIYTEFWDRNPGQVFLVATRELWPGEEVFVEYGCYYWGIDSYPVRSYGTELRRWSQLLAKESKIIGVVPRSSEAVLECDRCRRRVAERVLQLHQKAECGMEHVVLFNLDSLPENPLTLSEDTPLVEEFEELTHGYTHVRPRCKETMVIGTGARRTVDHTMELSSCSSGSSKRAATIHTTPSDPEILFHEKVTSFLDEFIPHDQVGRKLLEEGVFVLVMEHRDSYVSLSQLLTDIKFLTRWHNNAADKEIIFFQQRCDKEFRQLSSALRRAGGELYV